MESVKKLMREAMKLQQSPPEGIRLKLAEEDSFEEMLAFILGPRNRFSGLKQTRIDVEW